MFKSIWPRIVAALGVIVALGILSVGCKDDETTSPGGGGITTFNFTTAGQTLTLPSTGVAVKAKLTGGTLPYTITGDPNPAVATASLSTDTMTVTPVAPGSTSITITDSLGDRVVTIGITVSGGGGGGGLGSGTTTTTSAAGNLNLGGTGTWPPGAGPGVIAVYDTVTNQFIILGYQQVSGSHYNYILIGALTPGGPAAGTYNVTQTGYFQVGFNADTSGSTDTSAYTAINGAVVIGSVSGSNASGTYSGQGIKGSPPPVSFQGAFTVAFVRGRSPIEVGAPGRPTLGVLTGKKFETQSGRLR